MNKDNYAIIAPSKSVVTPQGSPSAEDVPVPPSLTLAPPPAIVDMIPVDNITLRTR